MNFPRMQRLFFLMLLAVIPLSITFAYAANIVVPTTWLSNQASTVNANSLKPLACSGITLTAIIYCPSDGGICNGTNADELIIGGSTIDTIQGKGGADCIIGGGGDDDITGSQSQDVCIGGPGNDVFKKCETSIQ